MNEGIKEMALRIAREVWSDKSYKSPDEYFVANAIRLIAELQKDVEEDARDGCVAHVSVIDGVFIQPSRHVPNGTYSLYVKDAAMAQNSKVEQPTLICPRCKVDRFKAPCPDNSHLCPMHGEVQELHSSSAGEEK